MKHSDTNIIFRAALAPFFAIATAVVILAGCVDNGIFTGDLKENQRPVIQLTNGPVEGDSIEYRVHFFWLGDDPDGAIDHYEIVMVDGDPIGFNYSDTTEGKWTWTTSTDSIFYTTADDYDTTVTIDRHLYSLYDKTHTFFIKAVDDRGGVSETLYRSFTSQNIAPYLYITEPPASPTGGMQKMSPVISFKWDGKDPIGTPWNYQKVDSTRYMYRPFYTTIVEDLNRFPENFEHLWSKWRSIDAPGDSGKSMTLGDDEIIPTGHQYIFAVQAKDEAGAVSTIFDTYSNVRTFLPMTPTGPMLTVRETLLGTFVFMGIDFAPSTVSVPPGYEMNFSWGADASHYGAFVSTYRYGWDIIDLGDPYAWATMPSPYAKNAPARTFYSGIHVLYIETTDNLGVSTLALIEVSVIPAVFGRDLMWVDDFPSTDFLQHVYAFPTEKDHDKFWTDICMRVPSFNPSRDIFDISENYYFSPPMHLVFKYKNIIWSFSFAIDPVMGCEWTKLILFTPEEIVPLEDRVLNYLTYYMGYGGHIWTEGMSQRTGGLGAALRMRLRQFPSNLKCNMGYSAYGCPDHFGTRSMPYRDYCVSVIDKVEAVFRLDLQVARTKELDALVSAWLDDQDPFSSVIPGFPKKLELWDVVTQPGMFFFPPTRGFHYIEVFDPEYWMAENHITKQPCFHPIYRMRARVVRSPLHNQTVAFWTSKYADVDPDLPGTVAAPSIHFGLPLYYFNREQVDSIADAIFQVWDIR